MIYVALLAFIALVSGKDRCGKITDIAKCESTEKCKVKDDVCVMEDKRDKKMRKWIEQLKETGAPAEEVDAMDYGTLKKAVKGIKKLMKMWKELGCDKEEMTEEEIAAEGKDGDKKKWFGYGHGYGYGLGYRYGYGRRLEKGEEKVDLDTMECADLKKWYGYYGYRYGRRLEKSE